MSPRSTLALRLLTGGALFLVACGPSSSEKHFGPQPPDLGAPPFDPNADRDHDGYTFKQGDCDDDDPTVHPGAPELCDKKDHDCNGIVDDICDDDKDGYNVCPGDSRCVQKPTNGLPGGDCNDNDPTINPGAYEVPKNGRDDDCDGVSDEPYPACDTNLSGADATTFAAAMDLCKPWLLDAQFNKISDPSARRITNHFGVKWVPQSGDNLAYFSTGIAADEKDFGYVDPYPGTVFQGRDLNPLPIRNHNICTGGVQEAGPVANDMVSLTLTIKVPTNAKGFRFRFNFFSAEFPEFVGNQYNDMFVAVLDSKKFPMPQNVSFDANGDPVTVDNAFFKVCYDAPICRGVQNPKVVGSSCAPGTGDWLIGTGYERFNKNGDHMGGATGWLSTTAPVVPGETIHVTFFVFDAVDHYYDSAVLLDSFQWLFDDAVLMTMPVM